MAASSCCCNATCRSLKVSWSENRSTVSVPSEVKIVNSYLFKVYLASALATCSLTTPLFGVLVAAAITGDELSPRLLLSSVMVAAGIGLTVRR